MANKNLQHTFFILALGVVLLFACGIIRDAVFTNLNKEFAAPGMKVVQAQPFSNNNTTILKWGLTLLFSVLYALITSACIFVLHKKKNFVLLTILVFFSLFTLSLIITGLGYLLGKQEISYRISRDVMGLVQSPFLLMLLVPAFYFSTEKTSKTSSET